ncbi:MAG: tRNA lysidine(34) synthetase TilS [Hyphomicrobiales bacterium]|nr:tRNA lysidine(34) synthetase TilS [Hyphomicrobiales bacterium]
MPELRKAGKRRKASARGAFTRENDKRRFAPDHQPLGPDEAKTLLLPFIGSAQCILLAVSGGPDSVALMRLFSMVAKDCSGTELRAATVDHGLRENSRAEAEKVGTWARDCGVEHQVLRWKGRKPSTRIQERARNARYALLDARARDIGAMLLVTAHTLDDQAETLLMRMAHGSGIAGLAGMRRVSERSGLRHARPFLNVPKARLLATCQANGWEFVEDPSNEDPRFARARWRRLAPALAREGLTAARLAKLAERAATVEEALRLKTEAAFAAACLEESARSLALDMERIMRREPRELALRVLTLALNKIMGERPSPIRLERAEGCLDALSTAFCARKPLKRTLGGALLDYDGAGCLRVRREGARRRGRKFVQKGPKAAVPARVRRAPQANQSNSIALSTLV